MRSSLRAAADGSTPENRCQDPAGRADCRVQRTAPSVRRASFAHTKPAPSSRIPLGAQQCLPAYRAERAKCSAQLCVPCAQQPTEPACHADPSRADRKRPAESTAVSEPAPVPNTRVCTQRLVQVRPDVGSQSALSANVALETQGPAGGLFHDSHMNANVRLAGESLLVVCVALAQVGCRNRCQGIDLIR